MKLEVVYGNEKAIQPGVQVEAVKLVRERGVSVVQAVRDLDVVETVLRRWMRELTQDLSKLSPAKG